jgi:hypothetical protein
MKIEGDTIVFKSWPHWYKLEKKGIKPATVRQAAGAEKEAVRAYLDNYYLFRHGNTPKPRIEIRNVDPERADEHFRRELLSGELIGEILDSELYLFCWRHEESENE